MQQQQKRNKKYFGVREWRVIEDFWKDEIA